MSEESKPLRQTASRVERSYPVTASEPVAWQVLSESGAVRLWAQTKDVAETYASARDLRCVPLYAAPQHVDPAQCSPDPWRTDMENRPKDRPYLVEEDDGSRVRYHVAEWKGDKENGILVVGGAFSFDRAKLTRWRDFELPAPSVPSTDRGGK